MKIKTLALQTASPTMLAEFYSSIMELPVQVAGDHIRVKVGNSHLIFIQSGKTEPIYHFALNIPSNNIEKAKDWLSKKNDLLWIEEYKGYIAEFTNWRARSIYFYDPAGNILELIARFDLKNESGEDFTSKQFLSINEVGLVFKRSAFEEETSRLLNKYSLGYFNKQPPLEQFRAIGDDGGLFVIVPEHRNWYPTNKPAGLFPMSIAFEHEENHYELSLNSQFDGY